MIEVRILGSGTSTGVPVIGCTCPVCTSQDSRDKRLRTSALISTDDAEILIDCGPDFRQQILRTSKFRKIDAVLITHEHYDHVGGIDDLRAFMPFGRIAMYAESYTADHLKQRLPYCLVDQDYPGVPKIDLYLIKAAVPFFVNNTEIIPIRVMYGKLPILGYVINRKLAYITDMLHLPKESFSFLSNLDLLIINALQVKEHPAHQNISQAIAITQMLHPKETYFIHMSHNAGTHEFINSKLPPHIHFAYDNLVIKV